MLNEPGNYHLTFGYSVTNRNSSIPIQMRLESSLDQVNWAPYNPYSMLVKTTSSILSTLAVDVEITSTTYFRIAFNTTIPPPNNSAFLGFSSSVDYPIALWHI